MNGVTSFKGVNYDNNPQIPDMETKPCANCWKTVEGNVHKPCIHGSNQECMKAMWKNLGEYFFPTKPEQVKREFNGGPAV